jgi:hypothetical protein
MSEEYFPASDLRSLLKTLERRAYVTYLNRLHASQRLAARQRAWNASIIATSTATTVASVALLADDSIYGNTGPTLLVCASVLALVASLVTSSQDYSARSRNMFTNYRRLQRLAVEAERLAGYEITQDEVTRLYQQYDALLDESENHTSADYYHAFPDKHTGKPFNAYREDALSAMPYLSLLAPIGLLVPLIVWFANGGN